MVQFAESTRAHSWVRFLSTYYVVNTLTVLLYVPFRLYFMSLGDLGKNDLMGFRREHQIYFFLLVASALSYRRSASMDEFVCKTLKYCKMSVIILLVCAGHYRTMAWFVIVCACLFFFLSYPVIDDGSLSRALVVDTEELLSVGDGSFMPNVGFVSSLTPAAFADLLERGAQRKGKQPFIVAMLFVTWADSCAFFAPTFSSLAEQYGSRHLRFVKVNIGHADALVKRLNIDMSPYSSRDLPSLFLFHRGKQMKYGRLPPKAEDGSTKKVRLDGPGVAAYFGMESLREGPEPGKKGKKARRSKVAEAKKSK